MSHVLTMPALDWRILSIDFHVQVTTCKVLISQLRFIAIVQFVCYLLLHCCALPICMYVHTHHDSDQRLPVSPAIRPCSAASHR